MVRPIKYDFAGLQIGHHLDVPLDPKIDTVQRVRQASNQFSKKYGGKFVTRTIRPEGVARCTRVG